MTRFEDTKEYRLGSWAEEVAEKLLQKSGFSICSKGLFTGEGAPKVRGQFNGRVFTAVMPDIDAAIDGKRFWIEVKGKTTCGYYRKYRCYTHGVRKRLWAEYQKIQDHFGTPVFLMVVEKSTGNFLVQRIDTLDQRRRDGDGDLDDSFWFDRDDFVLWATLGDGELFTFRNRTWINSEVFKEPKMMVPVELPSSPVDISSFDHEQEMMSWKNDVMERSR